MTQYPNNKPTNQRGGNKGDKRKGDDPKSEDKDSNTGGTAGAHVEDTTTNENTTAPSGGAQVFTPRLRKCVPLFSKSVFSTFSDRDFESHKQTRPNTLA